MATKTTDQLKSYFRKGMYPTEGQFADLIESFRHKDEKVTIAEVKDLPQTLNGKYNASEGEILEKRQQVLDGKVKRVELIQESQSEDIDDLKDENMIICDLIKTKSELADAHKAIHDLGDNYNSLYALAQTVKTFLETTDTKDTTINTWVEVEDFLRGITDTSSLTALLKELEANITEAYKKAITDASLKDDIDKLTDELEKARNLIKNGSTVDDSKTALETLGEEYKDLYALASTVKARFETPEEVPGNYVENVMLENGSDINADNLINEDVPGATSYISQGNWEGTNSNFPANSYSQDGFHIVCINFGNMLYRQIYRNVNSNDTWERHTGPKGTWGEWKKVGGDMEISNKLNAKVLTSENLDDLKDDGFVVYYGVANTSVINKPPKLDDSEKKWFSVIIVKVGATDRLQIFRAYTGTEYRRYWNNISWSPWVKQLNGKDILVGATNDGANYHSPYLSAIPTNIKIFAANFNIDVTIGLDGKIPIGENITIIMCNASSGSRTINLTNIASSHRSTDTITVEAGKTAEINIAYDGIYNWVKAESY